MRIYIPRSLSAILQAKSTQFQKPSSKLICIALDNELEVENAFYYPAELPTSPFIADAYANEAGNIFRFLEKVKSGLSLDHLVMARRDMSIQSKDVFLLAFRELVESGMIEDFYPDKAKFKYPEHVRFWRVKMATQKTSKRNPRIKTIEE